MPQAKKTASRASRSKSQFKEPAALKRLTKSLDAAQDALSQLQTHTGRDVSKGARDLYKDVKVFVSSARRDSGKFAKTLQRDFDELQKRVAKTTSRSSAKKPAAKRTTARKSTSTRAKASTARATSSRRTATKRTATKRTTGTTRARTTRAGSARKS